MAMTRLLAIRLLLPSFPPPRYKTPRCRGRGGHLRLIPMPVVAAASHSLSSAADAPPCSGQTQTMARLEHGSLLVAGRELLARAPPNVTLRPAGDAAFLGARADAPSSRHVFSIGTLASGWRWLSLFRFKIWWMVPATGAGATAVPAETQMLLLESRREGSSTSDEGVSYALMLPVLDGGFRASLQGSPEDELQFCFESGDPEVQTTEAVEAVFINSGDNPFKLLKESIKTLSKIKGTFAHIEDKEIPANLDWFGWCTWDAFYKDVNPTGIEEGLQSLCEGGAPPRFLIIDDGWQETVDEFKEVDETLREQTVFALRLADLKENHKFRGDTYKNLRDLVKKIKEKHGVKYVYAWHALLGYWGGVLATSNAMKKYNPKLVYPVQSPGNVANLRDIAMDSLENFGVGVIDPAKIYDFYNDQHSYLTSVGVDGVKVDVQNVLETLGQGFGGRVAITQKYQHALEASIAQNFKGNNLICCMSHNSDSIFSDKPGVHDFSVLKKLVLPDGSILRAKHAGRPTRDCLFNDPVMDGKRHELKSSSTSS
ncbi:hypothetical protein PR202_gb15264 [Eleusine coracana subsp. coracana]|uniref:galactinol--sucrose galactosyltransferase n=1 Tax=Eleusine coracana subsp. coracana TaxID=191504 RepID=A0AAV5EXE3_ELECO|nr:hypothetical protein PR202_gb15264 [Eleusine coracana subsp. coracana]